MPSIAQAIAAHESLSHVPAVEMARKIPIDLPSPTEVELAVNRALLHALETVVASLRNQLGEYTARI